MGLGDGGNPSRIGWETRWRERGGEYDDFKQRITDTLLGQYQEIYPGAEAICRSRRALDSALHPRAPSPGSMYGPEPERFTDGTLVPRTAIRGLHLAGSDTGTPGITGALIGGALPAVAAEPIRAGRYLQRVISDKPRVEV